MKKQIPQQRHLAMSVSFFLLFLFIFVATESLIAQSNPKNTSNRSGGKIADIVRDPAVIPAPLGNRAPTVVRVTLVAREVVGQLDPAVGTVYRYWTFNGKVPGPMIRVKQGDTVEVTLRNDAHSTMVHSVDFHAALGPGGGADISQVLPGESKTFTFKATTAGLFVYHCGTPMIAQHVANGMYGLILVEPPQGLPRADREYYIMQGELYTNSNKGTPGLQQFSNTNLLQENPQYFVFNGAVGSLNKEHPLRAEVGQTVRIYFGDAGPNATSSFHVVGEIFTRVYALGSLTSPPMAGVQTVSVPPGGAAVLDLTASMPGNFTIIDHAMARMEKGLMGVLEVTGTQDAALMHVGPAVSTASSQTPSFVSGMTKQDMAEAANVNGDAAAMRNGSSNQTSRPGASAGQMASISEHDEVVKPTHQSNSNFSNPSSEKPAEMNGCLRLQNDGKAMLHVMDSSKVYRLEAQPFLFSENANRLVHVTGQFGSVLTVEDPDIPSFVVEAVETLAHDCTTKMSAAAIHKILTKTVPNDGAVVTMSDLRFVPSTVTINAGQKVTWKNPSAVVHNVVDDAQKALNRIDVKVPAAGKQFDSGWLRPNQSFSVVFTVPGTYRYVCTLHEAQGMKGVIIVRALPAFASD